MNYDNKLYVVYSLPLMGFLSEHGIKYVKARLDKWDPNKMIWLYKQTDEFFNILKMYKN